MKKPSQENIYRELLFKEGKARKLTLSDIAVARIAFNALKESGRTSTAIENVANYFATHGYNVTKNETGWNIEVIK